MEWLNSKKKIYIYIRKSQQTACVNNSFYRINTLKNNYYKYRNTISTISYYFTYLIYILTMKMVNI